MGHHPFFASPLDWHDSFDGALLQARAEGTCVLAVHGHRLCGGTRALVERSLRKEELVEFVVGKFVMLASDSDAPGSWFAGVADGLAKREPTPLCLYFDATGKLVSSTAGGRPPAVLLNDMMQALSAAAAK